MLPLLSVFSLLNWLPVVDTIELEEVVLARVATLLTDPPELLLSFDLSSSARLATLLAEPKLVAAGSSGAARLSGKCERFVLDTLRMGGGGGGFMTGGFGGGAAGRPMGLFCLAIDSDDWKLDGGPRSVPKWFGKFGPLGATGGDLGLLILWCLPTMFRFVPLDTPPPPPLVFSCIPGGFGARFGLP